MKKAAAVALASLVILFFYLGELWMRRSSDPPLPKTFGSISWKNSASINAELGNHRVKAGPDGISIWAGKKEIWKTGGEKAFLSASTGELKIEEYRGSFSFRYRKIEPCSSQSVNSAQVAGQSVHISGMFQCGQEEKKWSLIFSENKNLDLEARVEMDPSLSRTLLRFGSSADEHIFGAGEQFTHFNLKGYLVPIWVSEQGIGRGLQPLTFFLDLFAGAGGNAFTTYFSSGQILTSLNRGLVVHNSAYGEMDFRDPGQIVLDYWSHSLNFTLVSASSPKELLKKTSQYTGRMRALPDWVHRGAILGLQGGTQKVEEVLEKLKGVPLAGVWLQDWVGQRKTSIGKQLWWNWELNEKQYPHWGVLKGRLQEMGLKALAYVNPFLVDLPRSAPYKRRLAEEAARAGYLVKGKNGHPLSLLNTSFTAFLLDLSQDGARSWMKEVLRANLVGSGFSGWMADFGEALPVDAQLKNADPREFHNLYPVEWAKLNRETIDGLAHAEDFVFFTRSGFTRSPAYSTLFWTGDQLVTWDGYDGMRSSLTALLSSGVSGAAFNHSDIGGYTSFKLPFFSYLRTEELLIRWMELNAFTVVFRTHEGNQPENSLQVYSNERLQEAFRRNARLFHSLFSYRKRLIKEAAQYGWPVVRPMWLEFPEEKEAWDLQDQFMLGSEILVAPVLDAGAQERRVFFPKGRWRHLITGDTLDVDGSHWVIVKAPIGQPAAYRRLK